jgi:hypothetical protein
MQLVHIGTTYEIIRNDYREIEGMTYTLSLLKELSHMRDLVRVNRWDLALELGQRSRTLRDRDDLEIRGRRQLALFPFTLGARSAASRKRGGRIFDRILEIDVGNGSEPSRDPACRR